MYAQMVINLEHGPDSNIFLNGHSSVVTTATIGIEAGPESEHVAKRRAGRMEDEAGKTLKAGRPASDEDVKIWGTEGFTRYDLWIQVFIMTLFRVESW